MSGRLGFSWLLFFFLLLCETEPEFRAAASEEPPGSQGFLDKRPPSRVPSEPLGAAAPPAAASSSVRIKLVSARFREVPPW